MGGEGVGFFFDIARTALVYSSVASRRQGARKP